MRAEFSTFLYYRGEFENDLVTLNKLRRGYNWYTFMGGKYDIKRKSKLMSDGSTIR